MDEADAVRKWLDHTGFPLEFEVAKALRAEGLQVFQGLHYGADNAEASGAHGRLTFSRSARSWCHATQSRGARSSS
jgi:hypothetical protein